MQIRTANKRPIDVDRVEQTGNAHHTGSGRSQLHTAEMRIIQLILPLECNQPVLVMAGCAKAFAVTDLFILHDEAIHRICKLLGIHAFDRIADHLFAVQHIQIDVRHNGKAVVLQEGLLPQLAFRFQIITYQLECPELQPALLRLTGIELAHTAGCQVARMRIGFLKTGIDLMEISPRDNAFTADLERSFCRNCQRHVQEGPNGMRYVLTNDSFSPTGNGLLQFSRLISQNQRKTIHFPAQQYRALSGKFDKILHRFGLAGRQHWLRMPYFCQCLQDLSGHFLSWGAGEHKTGIMFQ